MEQENIDYKGDRERLEKALDNSHDKLVRVTTIADFARFTLARRRGVPDHQLADDIDAFMLTIK